MISTLCFGAACTVTAMKKRRRASFFTPRILSEQSRSDDRVELREVAVQPRVPFGEKLVLMSGAQAAARRFTIAGVKRIDDFHSGDDAAEWRETFSVVLPVVAQVDEDLGRARSRRCKG